MQFEVYEQFWFAAPIWECLVKGADNKSIREYCLEVKKQKPGTVISNRGGWHSKEVLYPVPDSLADIFNHLNVFVSDICANQTGIRELEVGNFWININGHHDYNIPHDHQKSILSGVYYVSVPENNMGDLIFHRGDTAEFFLPSDSSFTPTFSTSLLCRKPPKESVFYLFPSWVKHSVERNESFQDRISIAFNIVMKKPIKK